MIGERNDGMTNGPVCRESLSCTLILAAAAELAQTDSATTARAVLWRQHLRERSTRP